MKYTLPIRDLRIESDYINALETITFGGSITLIDNVDLMYYALDRISTSNFVGFDTESRPAFLKGQKFPVSIMQLSLEDEAFIIKLKKTGLHKDLIHLLSDDRIKKLGIGVRDDIKRLNELESFSPQGFIDLSDIAKRKGVIQSGARALTARYLGKKLLKTSQKTNWARSDLSGRQLKYAATDAWICLHLYDPLMNDNTDYHKMAEEFLAQSKLDLEINEE